MSATIHALLSNHQDLNPDVDGNFPLDEAVIAQLPTGTKILAADSYGSSAWTVTARISTILKDGTPKLFFLKCATEDAGRKMMEGEFNSMTELYNTMSSFVPKPLAWGKFKLGNPETYFFLCDFIDMNNDLPDPADFCAQLAELHSISKSPTGKFGFHITTCHGRFPQHVEWDSSWQSFFRKLLADALRLERETNEPWPELQAVSERVLTKVIPQLLGPLEADGRTVQPSLIHGDLWEGNIGTCLETGNIYVFDAGAYYAHNEMEIGMWRCERHQINSKEFRHEYLKNAGISEPAHQFDDRNRIYCVKMNIIHAAHHPGCKERTTAYEDMCYLAQKYDPEGFTAATQVVVERD